MDLPWAPRQLSSAVIVLNHHIAHDWSLWLDMGHCRDKQRKMTLGPVASRLKTCSGRFTRDQVHAARGIDRKLDLRWQR
tara:strand:- start:123 stop:359 length:237 start_codon:yes stop_codon:yes gene_type:complete